MEYKGIEYLRLKLAGKRARVNLRYSYYEMKNLAADTALMPENFRGLREVLGWCAKAVDTLADRVVFDRFENDAFMLNQIFKKGRRNPSPALRFHYQFTSVSRLAWPVSSHVRASGCPKPT